MYLVSNNSLVKVECGNINRIQKIVHYSHFSNLQPRMWVHVKKRGIWPPWDIFFRWEHQNSISRCPRDAKYHCRKKFQGGPWEPYLPAKLVVFSFVSYLNISILGLRSNLDILKYIIQVYYDNFYLHVFWQPFMIVLKKKWPPVSHLGFFRHSKKTCMIP